MKYCDSCGNKLDMNANTIFCSNCGKKLSSKNQDDKGNSGSIIICAIVGLLFPIIGAILYYVLKKTDMKAAKTANICSWLGFLWQIICFASYGITIFSFF